MKCKRGKPADDFARVSKAFRWIPSEELELPFSAGGFRP
jgi:hypothetical protein